MRKVQAMPEKAVFLGYQGENNVTQVSFPVVKEWKALYGNGVFSLVHKRPGEAEAYPIVITVGEEEILWKVSAADDALPGFGVCEIIYTIGSSVAKSALYLTEITGAIVSGSTPPSASQNWVDTVIQSGLTAQNAANVATEKANQIKNLSVSATTLQPTEAASVTKTETENAIHLAFGLPKGAKGDKGDQGNPGPQGQQGAKGDKGDKGDTGEGSSIYWTGTFPSDDTKILGLEIYLSIFNFNTYDGANGSYFMSWSPGEGGYYDYDITFMMDHMRGDASQTMSVSLQLSYNDWCPVPTCYWTGAVKILTGEFINGWDSEYQATFTLRYLVQD